MWYLPKLSAKHDVPLAASMFFYENENGIMKKEERESNNNRVLIYTDVDIKNSLNTEERRSREKITF